MNTQEKALSPVAFLSSIAIANLLFVAGYASLLTLRPARAYNWHTDLPSRLPALLMITLGLVSSLLAERLLRKGLKRQRWTERQLAPVRKLVGSSAFPVLIWALFAGALLTVAIDRGAHASALFWIFLGPLFSLARVRNLFPPADTVSLSSATLSLSNAPPLQSEHWGA